MPSRFSGADHPMNFGQKWHLHLFNCITGLHLKVHRAVFSWGNMTTSHEKPEKFKKLVFGPEMSDGNVGCLYGIFQSFFRNSWTGNAASECNGAFSRWCPQRQRQRPPTAEQSPRVFARRAQTASRVIRTGDCRSWLTNPSGRYPLVMTNSLPWKIDGP